MKKLVLNIFICILSFTGVFFFSKKAQAGSINGNEASVISAAQSTFEYKGRQYVAKSAYIATLRKKLSEDGVDLTSEQASEAIGTMYANVATGVESGYLEEVKQNSSSDYNPKDGISSKDLSDNTKDQESSSKKDKSDSKDKSDNEKKSDDSSSDDNSNISESGENDETQSDTLNGFEDEMKVIDNHVNELDISGDNYEFAESVPITTAAVGNKFKIDLKKASSGIKLMEQSSTKDINRYIKKVFLNGVMPVVLVFLIIFIVGVIIFIFINREFKFDKIINQIIGFFMMIFGIIMFTGSVFINYGFLYSDNFVNKVAGTRYYNNIFETLHGNIDNILEDAGFEKGDLDEIINERQVYLAGKLNLEAEFNKNRTRDFLNVQNSMYEVLSHKIADNGYLFNQETADKTGNLSGMIQSVYRDSLKFNYASEIVSMRNKYNNKLILIMIIGIILFLAGIVYLFITQKYIHRVTRLTGFSMISVGLSVIIGALYGAIRANNIKNSINPELYRKFFVSYSVSNSYLLSAMGIMILFFGIALIGLTKMLKDDKKNNPFKLL